MIDFSDVRIFLCTTPTNMHCSFDRLMGRAQEIFDQDPCSGHLFLFLNRNRDRMKILFWDRDGFCIFYKRLERGTFQLLTTANDTMEQIGEDVTRELEYEPAKLEAHIHTRPKYACRRCKDGVSAAPLPRRTIPGGIAGPGLITEVFVGKFGDHLPLYRLEDILTRYGVYISRSTMSGWMKAVAELLRPLYDFQRKLVLQGRGK
jgi:transposase